jgi:hypothetical protein
MNPMEGRTPLRPYLRGHDGAWPSITRHPAAEELLSCDLIAGSIKKYKLDSAVEPQNDTRKGKF